MLLPVHSTPHQADMPCAARRCQEVGFPLQQLHWQQGVAEELPLPDDSQDVVISTLVRQQLAFLLCYAQRQHHVRRVARVCAYADV
jgi:ubiquinone/menaquinone biosynthesis C-methylase UbiE